MKEAKIPFQPILTAFLGIASSLFIVAVIGLKIINVEREKIPPDSLFIRLTFNGIYESGLLILLGLFPFLLFPLAFPSIGNWSSTFSNPIISISVILCMIVEVIWGVMWAYTWRRWINPKTKK